MKMPLLLFALVAIDLILSALAFIGGIYLLLDPTGSSLGMNDALQYIPFVTDFMVFALWLLLVFGAFPLVLVYGLLTDRKWALYGSLALGALELLWIAVQLVLLYTMGINAWQVGILAMGVISLFLVLTPSARSFLLNRTATTGQAQA